MLNTTDLLLENTTDTSVPERMPAGLYLCTQADFSVHRQWVLPFLVVNDNCGTGESRFASCFGSGKLCHLSHEAQMVPLTLPWGSPLPAWCSFTPQCPQGWHQGFVTPVTTSRLCCCDCLFLESFMPKKQVCGPVHSTSVSPSQWAALLWGCPQQNLGTSASPSC